MDDKGKNGKRETSEIKGWEGKSMEDKTRKEEDNGEGQNRNEDNK